MTWHLLTLFSLLVFQAAAASVSGKVTVVRSAHGKVKPMDCSGVVISLTPDVTSSAPVPEHFEMLQRDKTFVPHVLAVTVGSTVNFPNVDPIFHNAFSNYDGQIFDIGLYPPGSSRKITFRKPGVVRVFCNIHSSMSAVIIVLGTPYFVVTERSGQFRIDNMPEGSYRLEMFAEQATEESLAASNKVVRVASSSMELGETTLVESGYLTIPHLNKYGKPYAPQPDPGAYPGAQK